jgi:hypothetical protein
MHTRDCGLVGSSDVKRLYLEVSLRLVGSTTDQFTQIRSVSHQSHFLSLLKLQLLTRKVGLTRISNTKTESP